MTTPGSGTGTTGQQSLAAGVKRGWFYVTDERPDEDNDIKKLAANLFNGTWRLLEKEDRSADDDARMIHMAHASIHHWSEVGTAVNLARGEWQCSRVYATLGRSEPALYHARRALEICEREGLGDFDLAFSFEAMARAHAVAGDESEARQWLDRAKLAAKDIAEDEDRELLLSDLQTVPGFDGEGN